MWNVPVGDVLSLSNIYQQGCIQVGKISIEIARWSEGPTMIFLLRICHI